MSENKQQGDEAPVKICICKSCGEEFRYGSEGDNELYHLRCEREDFLENHDFDEFDRDDY